MPRTNTDLLQKRLSTWIHVGQFMRSATNESFSLQFPSIDSTPELGRYARRTHDRFRESGNATVAKPHNYAIQVGPGCGRRIPKSRGN